MMARRGFGKTVFAPIRDSSGDLQLYLNVDHLDAGYFATVLPELSARRKIVEQADNALMELDEAAF